MSPFRCAAGGKALILLLIAAFERKRKSSSHDEYAHRCVQVQWLLTIPDLVGERKLRSLVSLRMKDQVLDTPRPAAVRCRARTDNVAGVKLPVFESYETGSEVGKLFSTFCFLFVCFAHPFFML